MKCHRYVRVIHHFIWGLFLGILFHLVFLRKFAFPPLIGYITFSVICLILALGNALSIQIRCICLLVLPSCCGNSGRDFIKALLITLVIAGPIHNIVSNGKEVARVFSCSVEFGYNLSQTRYDLMVEPFHEALLGVKVDLRDVQDTLRSVNNIIAPITDEIGRVQKPLKEEENSSFEKNKTLNVNNVDVYAIKYSEKLNYTCDTVLSKAAEKCRTVFFETYDRCFTALTLYASFACWPFQLTFICNFADDLRSIGVCNALDKIEPGLGPEYEGLLNLSDTMQKNFMPVVLEYRPGQIENVVDVYDAKVTTMIIYHKIADKKEMFDNFIKIADIILTLIFLRVIFASQAYHNGYILDIVHDNIYITSYFHKIDNRRHVANRMTLLPLKKMDRNALIETGSIMLTRSEVTGFFMQVLRLMLEVLMTTVFVLLDRLFCQALDIVRKHGLVEYTQQGSLQVDIKINGTGMISELVRSIVKEFNVNAKVHALKNNAECLPTPNIMNSIFIYQIYGGYVFLLLLIFLNSYISRLNRIICAYFYPKREKCRVLFIYNDTLRKQWLFVKYKKESIKRAIREHCLERDFGTYKTTVGKFATRFGWLKYFARRKCLICEEEEPLFQWRSPETLFHDCKEPPCMFSYCKSCWEDLGEVCYSCRHQTVGSNTNSTSDEDDNYVF